MRKHNTHLKRYAELGNTRHKMSIICILVIIATIIKTTVADAADAVPLRQAVTEFHCDSPELWNQLSAIGLSMSVMDQLRLWKKCVRFCPLQSQCWSQLAYIHYRIGTGNHPVMRIRALEMAASLNPSAFAHQAGLVSYFNGDFSKAMKWIAPEVVPYIQLVDNCPSDVGSLNRTTATIAGNLMFGWVGSVCLADWQPLRYGDILLNCATALAKIQKLVKCNSIATAMEHRTNVAIRFMIASVFDHQKDFNSAWSQYVLANRVKVDLELRDFQHSQTSLQKCRIRAFLDFYKSPRFHVKTLGVRSQNSFAAEDSKNNPREILSRRIIPVFVVGLPRTGSTLLVELLRRNQNFITLGETSLLANSQATFLRQHHDSHINWKGTIEHICKVEPVEHDWTAEQLNLQGNRYRLEVADVLLSQSEHNYSEGKGNLYVVDKQLQNWYWVPWIQRILPEAIVLNARRKAIDTAISNFFADFDPPSVPWSSDIDLIVDWFSFVHESMKDIASLKQQPKWITIWYEDLVRQPNEILKLVSHYTQGYTKKHKQVPKRIILTASALQATKPIHLDSIERWKRFKDKVLLTSLSKLHRLDTEKYE